MAIKAQHIDKLTKIYVELQDHFALEKLLVKTQSQEIERLNNLIDWWRGRYNDVAETITDVANGREVEVSDTREYPFSNGAKAIIQRVQDLTAEVSNLKLANDEARKTIDRLNAQIPGKPVTQVTNE